MTTHYETLGVGDRASQQMIKEAFRVLARKWHPDKHEGRATRAQAEERFKEITHAYAVLTDPHKKLMYDAQLEKEREAKRGHARVPVHHRAQTREEWRKPAEDAVERAAAAERRAAAEAKAQRRAEGEAYYVRREREKTEGQAQGRDFVEFLRAKAKKAAGTF